MSPSRFHGKTVRGAGTQDQKAPHLLSFCTHHSQQTLLQIRVGEKTNEILIALAFLPALPVAGRVFTADARPTHVPFFQAIQALGGDAVFTVKENQPTLQEQVARYFADPLASFEEDETIDLQRGRKEVRSIKVTSALCDYLQPDWPGVARGWLNSPAPSPPKRLARQASRSFT